MTTVQFINIMSYSSIHHSSTMCCTDDKARSYDMLEAVIIRKLLVQFSACIAGTASSPRCWLFLWMSWRHVTCDSVRVLVIWVSHAKMADMLFGGRLMGTKGTMRYSYHYRSNSLPLAMESPLVSNRTWWHSHIAAANSLTGYSVPEKT